MCAGCTTFTALICHTFGVTFGEWLEFEGKQWDIVTTDITMEPKKFLLVLNKTETFGS